MRDSNKADEGGSAAIPVVRPKDFHETVLRLGADTSMRRNRPYDGQPHTDEGVRGRTEVRGITFRDLRDCFIRAVLLSAHDVAPQHLTEQAVEGERAILCANDLYGFDLDRLDPMAICQNLCCEVERVMGIFPNLPGQKASNASAAPAAPSSISDPASKEGKP